MKMLGCHRKTQRSTLGWRVSTTESNSIQTRPKKSRDAFATFLVLAVIVALSFTIYSYAGNVFLEHSATRASIRQSQSRMIASSGVEALRAMVLHSEKKSFFHATKIQDFFEQELASKLPEFYGVAVFQTIDRARGRIGLSSESAKLNLNGLDLRKESEVESRLRLLAIPGMTATLADSLLDWIDPDQMPRTYGAEASWYADQSPQHKPPNRPLQSIQELTWVRGFDARLVYGEDTNGNGWLDWNENDGNQSLPQDNRDGLLDRGLLNYVGILGTEYQFDSLGQPKIYLNDNDLVRLHGQLESRLGRAAADFVVAYRLEGPVFDPKRLAGIDLKREREDSFDSRVQFQLEGSSEVPKSSTRGTTVQSKGLQLDRIPVFPIQSLLDLLDASVVAIVDNEEKVFDSPWKLSQSDPHALLLSLDELLTTTKGEVNLQRIDINQAPLEVLLTIPRLPRFTAENLVAHRNANQSRIDSPDYQSIYWLVQNRIMDREQLQKVAPWMTTHGSVYSGFSVGQDRSNGSAAIIGFTLSYDGRSVRLLQEWDVGFARLHWMEKAHH